MKTFPYYLPFVCVAMLVNPKAYAIGKVQHLTLKEAIILSLRYNQNIQSAELQRVVDKFSVAVARNQFEFQYALGATANASQSVSGGGPVNVSRNFDVVPGISKKSIYGTRYNLIMNNPVSFSGTEGMPKTQGYLYAPSLALNVTHPILQGSGRAVTEAALNQSLIANEQAKLNLKNIVMTQVTLIIQDYWAVVGAENALIVGKAALKMAEDTVIQNAVRIRIGFISPSENVQAEAAVASQKLQVARDINTLTLAKLALLRDIGLPSTTKIMVDSSIGSDNIPYPKGEEAKRILFENNISYLQAILSLKSSQISLLVAEDQQRWVLNLTGSIVQGAGSGIGPNGGIPSLFNGLNYNRNLGLALTVPIDNLSVQQTIVNAKVAYTQLKLNTQQLKLNLEIQLIGALENLSIVFQQIGLAKKSEQLAKQSYLDASKKATFGQASMFEVTTLQNSLISAQIQTISSEISYLINIANYQQTLGITLDIWKIKLVY
jgi:outer membrane protein TolC